MEKITSRKKLILYGCSGLGVNMLTLLVGSYLCSALLTGGFKDDIEMWTYLNKDLVVAAIWGIIVFIAKAVDGFIDLPFAFLVPPILTVRIFFEVSSVTLPVSHKTSKVFPLKVKIPLFNITSSSVIILFTITPRSSFASYIEGLYSKVAPPLIYPNLFSSVYIAAFSGIVPSNSLKYN